MSYEPIKVEREEISITESEFFDMARLYIAGVGEFPLEVYETYELRDALVEYCAKLDEKEKDND